MKIRESLGDLRRKYLNPFYFVTHVDMWHFIFGNFAEANSRHKIFIG